MELLAIPYLLAVGGLLAVQAAANVQLSAAIGSPFGASTLQLGLGAALLLALAAAAGALGALGAVGNAEPWHLAGGLGSAVYITAGILLFPRLGALVTVALFIAGQMLVSLLLDATGWIGVRAEGLDAAALAGALAVVAGAVLVVRAQAGAAALEDSVRARDGWLLLAVAAGAVLPVQGAINAALRSELDEPIAAGAWSFVIASAAMGAVLLLSPGSRRDTRPKLAELDRVPWWGWLGGLCGATYVVSMFMMIPEIGVAPTVALTVGGQQIASVFVDRHGLLRLPRRPITRARVTGVAILLTGVALIQVV